ncbi:hypothetical protein BG005_011652 [Podila minutissima]|nr:hypothetical protein BG005_011652 [Podila minutissima]
MLADLLHGILFGLKISDSLKNNTVRQTIGLASKESSQFGSSPEDGFFGLGLDTIESLSGAKTFMDNTATAGVLAQPRLFNSEGGTYLFGTIDNTKYTCSLTYVLVTKKGYWRVWCKTLLLTTPQDIIDGTTLIIFSDAAAQANHDQINGATNNPTTAVV